MTRNPRAVSGSSAKPTSPGLCRASRCSCSKPDRPRSHLADFERLTVEHIIARFDHTHLNDDTVEFNITGGGTNRSAENMARVYFELLSPAIRAAATGAKLRCVTVWENDKTRSTYPD